MSIAPRPVKYPEDRRLFQLTALLGDLRHKTEVYRLYQEFGPDIERFLTNEHQADYLRRYCPELVPTPDQPGQTPSVHLLGTIFEYHFEVSASFRLFYLFHLSQHKLPPVHTAIY